jgi:hypothetical protein
MRGAPGLDLVERLFLAVVVQRIEFLEVDERLLRGFVDEILDGPRDAIEGESFRVTRGNCAPFPRLFRI